VSAFYSGVRPNVSGYNPMHKEGAIILGIGGDSGKGSAGTFYEGVLTSGYPADSTEARSRPTSSRPATTDRSSSRPPTRRPRGQPVPQKLRSDCPSLLAVACSAR
jgi:hypothetical protein